MYGLSDLIKLFQPTTPVFSQLDLTPWKRQFRFARKNITSATMASRSKYKPHQGERERARRVRQIQRGVIKP